MFIANTDYIHNGQGFGEVGQALQGVNFQPSLMRPYFNEFNVPCVTVNFGSKPEDAQEIPVANLWDFGIEPPVVNATTLRKDSWLELDKKVLMAARKRLRAWIDLARSSTFGGFDGMSKMILEHETLSDPGEAVVDMDGMAEAEDNNLQFQLEGLPLPITHADFKIGQRKLASSRNIGMPLDTLQASVAGRRVAETIEKMTIGTLAGPIYGNASNYGRTPQVYGYTNFPARNTKTNMTAPTGSNGATVLGDWLDLRDLLYDANMFGPYMVYVSSDWDRYLDTLYSSSEPSAGTLRKKLLEIDGIMDIKRLDYLTDTFTVLMVQMDEEVARAVNGMDITTIQWQSGNKMMNHFKVMAIHVPQIRADYNDNCGIAHGTTA